MHPCGPSNIPNEAATIALNTMNLVDAVGLLDTMDTVDTES